MAQTIGASGVVGIAVEVTSGTYLAPTVFIPINKESLKWDPDMQERAPIRNSAGLIGLVPGANGSVSGDIEFDVSADILAYIVQAGRFTIVKSGTAPYVYTCTPAPLAIPAKTLSISIRRGNEVFGYTGCVVSTLKLSVDDKGIMVCTASFVGVAEATAAALTPVWGTVPIISAGMYSLQIPTATQIFDTDKFEFTAEESATTNPRIKSTLGAGFVNYGESRASITVERDFDTRAQYDLFKAGTSQSVTLLATQSATNIVSILMPVGTMKTYEVNLGGQGDLVRAKVEYAGVVDATGKHFQLVVTTSVNIT